LSCLAQNDGFGGGDNITENVLFHTCRESSDHGPINSWDRQVRKNRSSFSHLLLHTPFNTNDHIPRQARDRHKESTQKRPFFSQPFLTTVRTGKPSTQMEWRHVHNNIVIANYGACEQNAGFCAI
jgi:hypothetical protein